VKELPTNLRELGEFIREQRSLSRLSLRRFSELAGVSDAYLSQIERGLRKPSAEILLQIARALRISAETLYVRAGILEERDEGAQDVVKAIFADMTITEAQKQALVSIYQSFRHENSSKRGEGSGTGLGDAPPEGTSGSSDKADVPGAPPEGASGSADKADIPGAPPGGVSQGGGSGG
jgi:transcriptional regulator with XRE-family HTH domain